MVNTGIILMVLKPDSSVIKENEIIQDPVDVLMLTLQAWELLTGKQRAWINMSVNWSDEARAYSEFDRASG